MVKRWISETYDNENDFRFVVIDISEYTEITEEIKKVMATSLISSFRDIKQLKRRYENQPKTKLKEYIESKIFATKKDNFSVATRRGDWGEVLCGLILDEFRGYKLPVNKLKWKINNERSLFGTDVFAIKENASGNIESLVYTESKLRTSYSKDIGKEAYQSLYKDNGSSLPDIIDYISRLCFDKRDYEMADKFDNIYLNMKKYNKEFQIFLIFDKNTWRKEILDILNDLPPELDHLFVTIVLIDNLKVLIEETYELTIEVGEKLIYG